MARRKRIPYDPPHARKGGKGRRPGPAPRPDQIFMTRRMFLARGAVAAAFAALAAKLGHLQVVKREAYQALAFENITRPQTLKATRGVILDRHGRELAVNERTWEVRVLPDLLPKAGSPERARVLDQLINALNLPDALVLDPNGIPVGQEATVYARTAQLLGKVLEVEPTDQGTVLPVLETQGRVIRVDDQNLAVFVYPDEATRRRDSQKISADGTKITGQPLELGAPARFFAKGNVLTLLVTADDRLAGRVERAIDELGDVSTYEDVATSLRVSGLAAWTAYIESQKILGVLINLEDDLSTDQAALCRAHLNELPGVTVMNRLQYAITNGALAEKVVVRTGVPREIALKLEANKLALPGIELDAAALTRRYRGGEAMSHILGYVGQINPSELEDDANTDRLGNPLYQADDLIGKDGLEATMEPRLRGRPGFRMMELNPAGGPVRVVEGTEVAPEPGKNLTLTIDLELQRAVSQILQEGIRFSNEDRRIIGERDPKRPFKKASGAGSVVAIDPRNGEVLAMVSYPHYDNQLFVDGISNRKYKEYVSDLANKPLVDRALRGQYPPGSTLKPFMAAAALHEKTLDTTKTYTCTGAIQVPYAWDASKGNPHPCWQLAGHGALNVYEAIEQSCDVFFYNVAAPRQQIENSEEFLHYMEKDPIRNIIDSTKHYFEGMGIKAIKENLEGRFWFGQPTTIDLPGEAEGLVPDDPWKRRTQAGGWSVGDTINVSIGQGFFLTTPLQLALNTVALANKGTIHRPLLIREAFDDPKQDVERFVGKVLRRVDIAAEHLDVAREGMRRVVRAQSTNPNPTGKSKWVLSNPPGQPEIVIGGKTGTAEIGEADENGLYDRQHAVFTAFAPYDDPEIAIAVIVEDGGEGSTYAVPVADRVIRAFFELSGKRPRGTVLRADGVPDDPTQSVLAEGAAFPEPGINAVPGALPQD